MSNPQVNTTQTDGWEELGRALVGLAALAAFIGAWWHCAATYGFLFGFGIGWLPAGIVAAMILVAGRVLWPVAVGLLGLAGLAGLLKVGSLIFGY